jgi:hypothetical protein
MFRPGNALAVTLTLLALGGAAAAQGYTLRPGDLILADTGNPFSPDGAVRLLRADGRLETLASGPAVVDVAGVLVDRDGAVLFSHYRNQWVPENGIYRIEPATGALTRLNGPALQDNFHFLRDGNGDLIVADGFAGLARVLENGDVQYYSPPSGQFDVSIGVALDYDGTTVLTEAPNYIMGGTSPGSVFRVDAAGARTLLASDAQLTPYPNGIVLDDDGGFVLSNAFAQGSTGPTSVVRLDRAGALSALVQAAAPRLLRDVEPLGAGNYLLADAGEEAVVLLRPNGSLRHLVGEDDDGDPFNGRPVDRPAALALVPHVWMTTPYTVALGRSFVVIVRTYTRFAGQPMRLAVSDRMGPSAVPGTTLTSHLDLARASLQQGVVDSSGRALFVVTVPNDPALLGEELQLQAWLPAAGMLSNHVAVPVR